MMSNDVTNALFVSSTAAATAVTNSLYTLYTVHYARFVCIHNTYIDIQ